MNTIVPNNPPDPYRLTQLLVQNGGLMNRPALQALPVADLASLAHLMAAQRPNRFTPDLAWRWLRFIIEPMEWEVQTWASGEQYVGYWAGKPIACQPRTPDGYERLCATMRESFDETYPKTLFAQSAPLTPEASHAN